MCSRMDSAVMDVGAASRTLHATAIRSTRTGWRVTRRRFDPIVSILTQGVFDLDPFSGVQGRNPGFDDALRRETCGQDADPAPGAKLSTQHGQNAVRPA